VYSWKSSEMALITEKCRWALQYCVCVLSCLFMHVHVHRMSVGLVCKHVCHHPHTCKHFYITRPNVSKSSFFAMATLTKKQRFVVIGGILCVEGRKKRKDDCLLGCCAVQSGRSLPTLQRCLLPPSSGRWVHRATTQTVIFILAAVRMSDL
jgi:hypothetical protein